MCLFFVSNVFAQVRDDSQAAQQYVNWIQQAIEEDRWGDASSALARASDFRNVSSDISYLLAVKHDRFNEDRRAIVQNLDDAIQTNRWVIYNENNALLFKAQTLLALREYSGVLSTLDRIGERGEAAGTAQTTADAAMLRLLAFRGMLFSLEPIYDRALTLDQFRSHVLNAINRFPRDPRPLQIFFEYARNRTPDPSDLPQSDIDLLELALRRLPFLQEENPNLMWMAAPFIRDVETARRLVASYRAVRAEPDKASIPVALNLGVIDDHIAIEELFTIFSGNEELFLNRRIISETFDLLRSEEGRESFTQKLLTFSGKIFSDDDNDGFIDSITTYRLGIILAFELDRDQSNIFDLQISMDDGVPVIGKIRIIGQNIFAHVQWERYPSVKQAQLELELFRFGPVVFQYAPIRFDTLGGSGRLAGLFIPVPVHQYIDLTRRALISFCSSVSRPSVEFEDAEETIYINRGTVEQAIETLYGQHVSVTEFERGLPVIQHIDLDLDGRMETIRRFRAPTAAQMADMLYDSLDFRSLIASSESDWQGDGRHKTREVYLEDGSVVYYFDMEGTGQWTYSETRN